MAPPLAALYDFILALHITGVVLAFGWTFALPLMYVLAGRHSPSSLPLLHRIEYTSVRVLLNPALTVLLGAGIYLASDGHHWGEFFVQWGLGAAIVIGAVAGSVMIPTAKRAERAATADLAREAGAAQPSAEYLALTRRLNLVGSLLWAIVIATIVIMAVKP